MKSSETIWPMLYLGLFWLPCTAIHAQTREDAVVQSASATLDEIMSIPASAIPKSMLADAQGVAIIPGVIKGGFVIGIRHGRGVVVKRDACGAWQLPIFVTLTGGSVGWQAGVQATDVILVFKSKKSVQGLMRGKFTIGADAAAAAGPLGRQASAATDAQLRAEILSYSRSRGLFAGVSLDGSAIQIDAYANQVYYGSPLVGPGGDVAGQPYHVPPAAAQLIQRVANYTNTSDVLIGPGDAIPTGDEGWISKDATPTIAMRTQLANVSLHLYGALDETWQRYLALPPEIYEGNDDPSAESLRTSLENFDTVASFPQYRMLSTRQEFQQTHALLRRYYQSLTETATTLSLPPPPVSTLQGPK